MTGTGARRSWWGWGTEDQALTDDQATRLGASLSSRFGLGELSLAPVPDLGDLELAPPRVTPPTSLADRCSDDRRDRAGHTYGKSFRDVARAVAGRLEHPPDLVAHPRTEADVVAASAVDLLTEVREKRPDAVLVANGVDFELDAAATAAAREATPASPASPTAGGPRWSAASRAGWATATPG